MGHRIVSTGWKYIASSPAIDNDAEVECWLLGEDGGREKPRHQGGSVCCEPKRIKILGCGYGGGGPSGSRMGLWVVFPSTAAICLDGDGHVLPCLGILRLDAKD